MVRYSLAPPRFDPSLVRGDMVDLVHRSGLSLLGVSSKRNSRDHPALDCTPDRPDRTDTPNYDPFRFRCLDCGDFPDRLAHFQNLVGIRFLLSVHTPRTILQVDWAGRSLASTQLWSRVILVGKV
jgi:hypothetical protein